MGFICSLVLLLILAIWVFNKANWIDPMICIMIVACVAATLFIEVWRLCK